MKTVFPKKKFHKPKWFLINAKNKTLGRLASEASNLLMGKKISFFSPSVNQGNFVVIYNIENINVTGKKSRQKIYYRNSQRPGSLKKENYSSLKIRVPCRMIEKAIWGMLPKGILGRIYYKGLYIYSNKEINYIKNFKSSNNLCIYE